MLVTPLGIVMLVRAVELNALSPMLVTLLPIVAVARLVQAPNE
jgi:hypothetical protein